MKKRYTFSTILYAIIAVLSLIGIINAVATKTYWLAVLCSLITLGAVDNVFCGRRAYIAGHKIKTHYTFPILSWKH